MEGSQRQCQHWLNTSNLFWQWELTSFAEQHPITLPINPVHLTIVDVDHLVAFNIWKAQLAPQENLGASICFI